MEPDYRFCPRCGAPRRLKVVEFFSGHRLLDDGWLRLSAYFDEPKHVRISIWRNEGIQAALSLEPAEARAVARTLARMAEAQLRSAKLGVGRRRHLLAAYRKVEPVAVQPVDVTERHAQSTD